MADEVAGSPRVRVRGIYATALTNRLQDSPLAVVDASPAIHRRFEADFASGEADVAVHMTDDRQGIGIHGQPGPVGTVASVITEVGPDTFSWPGAAPRGAIVSGEVVRTQNSGAIVSFGDDGEGFLPFEAAEDYLDVGDPVSAQIHETHPPWGSDRPLLGTDIRAEGGIATLVRGVDALVAGAPGRDREQELARTTELLDIDLPDNWGVRWEYGARDQTMDVLEAALSKAVERAKSIEAALEAENGTELNDGALEEGSPASGVLAQPEETTWLWFGRDSRFALDDLRATVTPTMTGHHRMKAGSEAASSAVDFAERLGAGDEDFPFEAVTDVFGPTEGTTVTIRHGKPAGHCLTLGRGTVTDRAIEKERISVERTISTSGTYDALGTEREPGDLAVTRFAEGRWWAPTVYRSSEGEVKGTYVNISTPVELFPDTVRYLDLHVDVIKAPDGTVEVVDEDELERAVEEGFVPERVAEKARDIADRVADAFAEE